VALQRDASWFLARKRMTTKIVALCDGKKFSKYFQHLLCSSGQSWRLPPAAWPGLEKSRWAAYVAGNINHFVRR
jgi:hypothetical protein